MKCGNVIEDVSKAVFSATLRDLPDMKYPWVDPRRKADEPTIRTRRPEIYDIQDVEVFSQMWGSTALGFGGMGGAAMTTATVIIVTGPSYEKAVYFGGRFAYLITIPNKAFKEDVTNKRMCDVSSAKEKYEEEVK